MRLSTSRVGWLCLVPGLLLAGCELLGPIGEPEYAAIEDIRYERHVQFLLDERCASCHSGSRAAAGLDLSSWEGVMDGSDFGEAVIPFDARRSRMWRMVAPGVGGSHPRDVGGDTLSAVEVDFLKRWIEEGALGEGGRSRSLEPGPRVYAVSTSEAAIVVIDAGRLGVVAVHDLVQLGFPADLAPEHLAAAPDGSALYVSLPTEDAVLKLDARGRPVGLADVPDPGPLSLSADGSALAVGRSGGSHSAVFTVDTATMRATQRTMLYSRPHGVAISPDGLGVLAASESADQLAWIPTAGGDPVYVGIPGPRHVTEQLAFAPGGRTAYGGGRSSGQVFAVDVVPGSGLVVSAIAAAPGEPWQLSVSDDGALVFAPRRQAGAISVLDGSSLSMLRELRDPSLPAPTGSAVAAGRLFVSSPGSGGLSPRRDFGSVPGFVTVFDPGDGTVLRVLEVPGSPAGMAAAPSR